MNLAVIGGGRVGLPVATGLATLGHSVICCERDEDKRNSANAGQSPFLDIGLDEALAECVKLGTLKFCDNIVAAAANADAVFVAVPVSDEDNGLDELYRVVVDVVASAPSHCVLVIKSTLPLGVCAQLQEKFNVCVVANPEFLQQGRGFADFMSPSRIIIGSDDAQALQTMRIIYTSFIEKNIPYIEMTCATAEIAKLTANMFLSSRVALINEMADLCEAAGGDIGDVIKAVSTDKRIGDKYLQAGVGFGGVCLPKDGRLLAESARQLGVKIPAIESLYQSNQNRAKKIAAQIIKMLPEKPTIAVWGFAFKPGADDILESPAVAIVRELYLAGAQINGYDPLIKAEILQKEFPKGRFYNQRETALIGADILVILVAAEEFRQATADEIRQTLKGCLIYDCAGIFAHKDIQKSGLKLCQVGRGCL